MSAYLTLDTSDAGSPQVTYYPDLRDEPTLVIRIGRGSLHLAPEIARKLAEDILAALPEAVTA